MTGITKLEYITPLWLNEKGCKVVTLTNEKTGESATVETNENGINIKASNGYNEFIPYDFDDKKTLKEILFEYAKLKAQSVI